MEKLTGKQIGWFHEIIKDPTIDKKSVWKHFTDFDQNQKQIFIENLIRVYRNSQKRYRECRSG